MFGSRKMREKENWEENGRKEKTKEMNIIFFTCLVIHGNFKGKKIIAETFYEQCFMLKDSSFSIVFYWINLFYYSTN